MSDGQVPLEVVGCGVECGDAPADLAGSGRTLGAGGPGGRAWRVHAAERVPTSGESGLRPRGDARRGRPVPGRCRDAPVPAPPNFTRGLGFHTILRGCQVVCVNERLLVVSADFRVEVLTPIFDSRR